MRTATETHRDRVRLGPCWGGECDRECTRDLTIGIWTMLLAKKTTTTPTFVVLFLLLLMLWLSYVIPRTLTGNNVKRSLYFQTDCVLVPQMQQPKGQVKGQLNGIAARRVHTDCPGCKRTNSQPTATGRVMTSQPLLPEGQSRAEPTTALVRLH